MSRNHAMLLNGKAQLNIITITYHNHPPSGWDDGSAARGAAGSLFIRNIILS